MQQEENVHLSFATVVVPFGVEKRKYDVQLIHSIEGFSIGCAALPGCWSQGETEEEALTNIADAIHDYVEVTEELTYYRQVSLR